MTDDNPKVETWALTQAMDLLQRHRGGNGSGAGEGLRQKGWPTVGWRWGPLVETRGWAPAVEMLDKEDSLVVRAELPGTRREDIDVSIEGDTLTIRGERRAEEEVKEEDYYWCERAYGSFYRAVSLPTNVERDKIEASYKDGVLEVTLPKAKEAKPEKVEVKVT